MAKPASSSDQGIPKLKTNQLITCDMTHKEIITNARQANISSNLLSNNFIMVLLFINNDIYFIS